MDYQPTRERWNDAETLVGSRYKRTAPSSDDTPCPFPRWRIPEYLFQPAWRSLSHGGTKFHYQCHEGRQLLCRYTGIHCYNCKEGTRSQEFGHTLQIARSRRWCRV